MQINKLGILLLSASVIASCGDKHEGEEKPTLLSNVLSITDNEDKGIKEILGLYGGYCKYAIGRSSTGEGNKKYFELELSKSDMIEAKAEVAEMPASNIAYLFFKNLDKKERKNYDEIHTALIFNDGEELNYEYPSEQLELVDQKMKVVHAVVELIKEKNFDALNKMLDNQGPLSYDKNELMSKAAEIESQMSNISQGFVPLGFSVNEIKGGTSILHISGVIVRDKQDNEFSVIVDLNGKDNSIYAFQYKL